MQVLRLQPDRTLHLSDEPEPTPGPGEAVIRVTAVGLCGSDRHWFLEGSIGDAVLEAPLVLGHEFAGIAETGPLAGRRVAVEPAVSCGTCPPCRAGAVNLCLRIRFAGHGRTDGALREWMAWPESSLMAVADGVDDVEAAMVEPLAVAIHGVDLAGPLHGRSVAVVGCGPIGLLTIALARLGGARTIVATDPLPHRLAAAEAIGADVRVPVGGDGATDRAALLEATGGHGVDVAFEVSGEEAAVEAAVAVARPGGTVILLGIPPDDRTTFTASVARRKALTLILSRRSTPDSFRRAVGLAERHVIDLASLVTLRVPLADAAVAFDALARRSGIKVVIEPGGATRPA